MVSVRTQPFNVASEKITFNASGNQNNGTTADGTVLPKNNYSYNASVPAAYVFSVLFGLAMLVQIGQVIRYKTVFMVVLVIAIVLEFIGYFTRYVKIVAALKTR